MAILENSVDFELKKVKKDFNSETSKRPIEFKLEFNKKYISEIPNGNQYKIVLFVDKTQVYESGFLGDSDFTEENGIFSFKNVWEFTPNAIYNIRFELQGKETQESNFTKMGSETIDIYPTEKNYEFITFNEAKGILQSLTPDNSKIENITLPPQKVFGINDVSYVFDFEEFISLVLKKRFLNPISLYTEAELKKILKVEDAQFLLIKEKLTPYKIKNIDEVSYIGEEIEKAYKEVII